MQQFNLDIWLKDKSRKVVTRAGKPVRIVCWDSPNKIFPIVGFVDNEPEIFAWDCFGYCREGHIENENDLFFEDKKKEELTEFEKAIKLFVDNNEKRFKNGYVPTITDIKTWAEETLRFARNEILKDLPKWKKMPNGIQGNGGFNPIYLVRVSNGYCFTTPCLSWDKDSMYIELSELEKLPKEE